MKSTRFLVCLLLIGVCSGCTVRTENRSVEQAIEQAQVENTKSNTNLQIYDANNKVIGELELFYIVNQTNDGIIYTKIPSHNRKTSTELDYYRYLFETKESIKLGTVKDWSHEGNNLIYMNNHLYLLIATNLKNPEKSTLGLFDIDLNENTMTEVASEKSGDPRNTMAVDRNRILMTKAEIDGCSLEAYDTETKQMKQLKRYDFNSEKVAGEMIRHISCDKDTISLLILKMNSETDVSLRVDMFDLNMQFIRSVDLSCVSEDSNELRQGVVQFDVSNDYIYYENFSSTRYLGKIKGNRVESVMKTDGCFQKAYDFEKNATTKLYFQGYNEKNELYLVNEIDGTTKKARFHADDKNYSLSNVCRDGNNNYLLSMYAKDRQTGENYPERLYYIKATELEFK